MHFLFHFPGSAIHWIPQMPDQDKFSPRGSVDAQPCMEVLDSDEQTTFSEPSWIRRLIRGTTVVVLLFVACALLVIIAVPELADFGNRFSSEDTRTSHRSTEHPLASMPSQDSRRRDDNSRSPYSHSELKDLIRDLGGSWKSTNERLSFSGPQLTDAKLECVRWVPRLSKLSLSGTQITDSGLKHVGDLSSLDELNLSNTAITDAGLSHLVTNSRLRYLRLTGTQVTDEGIDTLKKLHGLKALDISDTQITEAGLRQIQEIKDLKFVYVTQGQFSEDGIEELTAALPDCQVISH
ncbi:MAG: hypothetical protein KDA52_21655 [Planctomycetaceae bacterium]|nr:hypothetical protein [Planctomycetaceae bacterium]